MRNIWRDRNDPTRCDNVLAAARGEPQPAAAAVIRQPVAANPLMLLARRKPTNKDHEIESRKAYICRSVDYRSDDCVDMCRVQGLWKSYLQEIRGLCNQDFWQVFLSMHKTSATQQDATLQAVKHVFVKTKEDRKLFPSSRRALMNKITMLPDFWANVLHTITIDLTAFDLPSGTRSVIFKFINPLWAWLIAARRQDPLELHWRPVEEGRRAPLYGGGIQFGQFFKTAYRSVPLGASIMAVNLHWDGTTARKLQASPICIGVGNTNRANSSTQFCVGYVPHVPDEKNRAWRETQKATTVKHYIKQRCARAILAVLEEAAIRGVRCTLPNQHKLEVERILFPRLCALSFDQPEAQSFFGLQNTMSCSKCRRRKGYSAFRRGSKHETADILYLYAWANDPRSSHRNMAREKLERWGFNYRRECCLLTCAPNLLVRVPGSRDLFPCVDFRDKMHGLEVFLHRVLMLTLDLVVKAAPLRRLLDDRLRCIGSRAFRVNGKTMRKPKSVFSDVDMSACDKVAVVFLLSYVLGPSGDDILPELVMMPLRTAVAHAQLMLIACRGQRMYTEPELRVIFDRGFVQLFGALESVKLWEYNSRVQEALNDDAPPPKRFKRQTRY